MRRNGCLVALAVALLALVILSPVVMRGLSLPHNSKRFEDSAHLLFALVRDIREYEKANGQRPASLAQLDKHSAQLAEKGIVREHVQYCPSARGEEPLLVLVHYYGSKCVMLSADESRRVRASRVWEWPSWTLREDDY